MKIAFIGNCHAEVLSRVLQHVYRKDGTLDARYFRTHYPFTDDDRVEIAASDLVVRQTADFASSADDLDTGKARVVRFPVLLAQFLWPFNTRDHPRLNEGRPGYGKPGFFTFPITDGQVIRLMKNRGVEPDAPEQDVEALLDEYMALDYAKLTNLDRQLDFTREKMRRAAETVGYDLWSGVERDFRSLQTFMTPLHPSNAVMLSLCREVLPRCGYPMTDEDILEAIDVSYGGDAIFGYAAPLHPSVIRHFGLNVPGDPPEFRFWYDGTITARALARRIVTLDSRQPVAEAFAVGHNGAELDVWLAALEAVAPDNQDNAGFLLHYGNLLDRIGRKAEALRTYIAGLRAAPGHAGLARRVTAGLIATAPQDFPPPVIESAEPVSFGRDGAGRAMMVGSWSHTIDPGAVWMEGRTGGLRFRLAPSLRPPGQDVTLAFRVKTFGHQQVCLQAWVYANGTLASVWSFDPDQGPDRRVVRLDPAMAAAPAINLSFTVSQSVSPLDLGVSQDRRSFGIGISEMTVEAA